MLKATGKGPNGEDILFIGLSYFNLDRFSAAPLDTFIRIDAKEMGLSHDVVIFSGRTEAEMEAMMKASFRIVDP